MSALVIAGFILASVAFSVLKGANVYQGFVAGAKKGFAATFEVFPCLVTIFVMLEIMSETGFTAWLTEVISPLMIPLGIPVEIAKLIILRPLSGSASIAVTAEIIQTLGADSYAARCASVIMGSSETVLYVTAVYFSRSSVKKTGIVVPVCIVSSFLAAVLACALLRVM